MMNPTIPSISPLRSGAKPWSYAASLVAASPNLSGMTRDLTSGSLSMFVPYPPRFALGSPPQWALKHAKEHFRVACATLGIKMVGEPAEYERQLLMDGGAEAWWCVMFSVMANANYTRRKWTS